MKPIHVRQYWLGTSPAYEVYYMSVQQMTPEEAECPLFNSAQMAEAVDLLLEETRRMRCAD
jgi:hypothetical protein